MIKDAKWQISRLSTEFRYSILVNLQRSYPKSVDSAQAIFIHIPKTAGTSLYSLIGYTGIGHVNYRWYESRDPNKFNQYFKFAFVRNPWDRLVSAFFYLKKGGSNAMDKHWAMKNIDKYSTFEEFVIDWVSPENINRYFHFIPQYKFIYDQSLYLKVDYVGKFENLNQDFEVVANKLNIHQSLPYINKSNRKDYQSYYSKKTKEIVAQVYKQDIELLGYRFS